MQLEIILDLPFGFPINNIISLTYAMQNAMEFVVHDWSFAKFVCFYLTTWIQPHLCVSVGLPCEVHNFFHF